MRRASDQYQQPHAALVQQLTHPAPPHSWTAGGISRDRFEAVTRGRRLGRIGSSARPPSPRRRQDRPEGGVVSEHVATEYEGMRPVPGEPGNADDAPAKDKAMQPRPAGSDGKDGTAAAPAARSGPAPRTLTDMPRAGWLAILKRSIREFKHDDITDRASSLTYYGVLALFP